MFSPVFFCLSVCKITKNACIDLDEKLLCRQMLGQWDMDELIKF